MWTCKRIHKPFCLLLLQHVYSSLCSLASSFPRHTSTNKKSKITGIPKPMCKSHHQLLPTEQRPGEGGERYIESVTACARKMAIGIKLYCWLILVHLFYNNKNKSISRKLGFVFAASKVHGIHPYSFSFTTEHCWPLLSTSFITNSLCSTLWSYIFNQFLALPGSARNLLPR